MLADKNRLYDCRGTIPVSLYQVGTWQGAITNSSSLNKKELQIYV